MKPSNTENFSSSYMLTTSSPVSSPWPLFIDSIVRYIYTRFCAYMESTTQTVVSLWEKQQ